MDIIFWLLTISLFVALVFFVAFIFSVKRGQYDDMYTPSIRILFDDQPKPKDTQQKNNNKRSKKDN